MNLNNLNKTTTAMNAAEGLRTINGNIKKIKRSNLDEEFKNKAIKEANKMNKSIFILTISSTLFILLFVLLYYFFCIKSGISDTNSLLITLSSTFALFIFFIIFIFVYFKKITSNYRKAVQYIEYNWDSLSEEEIEKLLPNENDNKIIKKINRLYWKWAIIWIAMMVSYILLLGIDLEYGINVFLFILLIILSMPYYIKIDNIEETRRFLKSGAYKRMYLCKKCGMKISVLSSKGDTICPDCKIETFPINALEDPEIKEEFKSKKLTIYTIILFSIFLSFNLIFIAPYKEEPIWRSLKQINKDVDHINENLKKSNESLKNYNDKISDENSNNNSNNNSNDTKNEEKIEDIEIEDNENSNVNENNENINIDETNEAVNYPPLID